MTSKEIDDIIDKYIIEHFPKGLYYNIIMDKIIGAIIINGTVISVPYNHMDISMIKGIYAILKNYRKNINKKEFIYSMEYVLADCFGDGEEVNIPDGAFDFIED